MCGEYGFTWIIAENILNPKFFFFVKLKQKFASTFGAADNLLNLVEKSKRFSSQLANILYDPVCKLVILYEGWSGLLNWSFNLQEKNMDMKL